MDSQHQILNAIEMGSFFSSMIEILANLKRPRLQRERILAISFCQRTTREAVADSLHSVQFHFSLRKPK
jgi:hypothetical protein